MRRKRFLSNQQRTRLLAALKEADSSNFIQRVLMLLLRNEGRTYQEISDFLGCSYRTVAYWCVHGDPDDLETLRDKRSQGNYRKATDDYIELLIEVVHQKPTELGYKFSRWSGERLAQHLAESTGIELSGSQVRNILRKYHAC